MMADDIFLISKLVTFSINVIVHPWLLNYSFTQSISYTKGARKACNSLE